ncbi:fatty acid desaturase family protein [Bauldia sp.]|uniref:fatty acid desaturase family protein n=1 Tax=Bauldia sp. TaxID=2575872 RepID=UPI003BAB97D9
MTTDVAKRDYSLVGLDTKRAEDAGLATAEWYHTDIPRKRLKQLMRRSDGPAIRDTAIWLTAFIVSGVGAYLTWGTWWCVPFFIVYGVLYGSSTDSRWHECGHRTAFRTQWMNDVVYQVASFMILREPAVWRWSHVRHHTDTLIVGRDPEIAAPRPPNLLKICLAFFGLPQAKVYFSRLFHHAAGHLSDEEKTYIPEMEWNRVYWTARVHVAIYVVVIGWSIAIGSILPLMFVGLPSFYGAWLYVLTGLTQHAGLQEDVLDHRLNCRTVYMNPIVRFLYWNMNYHIEHHMFPMVPYHNLPALHEEMKDDTPTPYSGFWEAYKEIIPTLIRQVKEPTYYAKRKLPPGAKPFIPASAPVAPAAAE